eukprot:jgi/Chlat1/98/Chrsp1S00222
MAREESVFAPLLANLPSICPDGQDIATQPFLAQCRRVIPVIESLGAALLPVKSDITGNIERLQKRYDQNPMEFKYLFAIPRADMKEQVQKDNSSCAKGLLWLKRALEFIVALLDLLQSDSRLTLSQAATTSYERTLSKYHGWITRNVFSLAMKVCPSRESFLAKLGPQKGTMEEMGAFTTAFAPILQRIHQFLVDNGLDDQSVV